MTKRKVLILVDHFEPGYKAGGPIRTLKNTLEALKDQFDFYLITRNTDIKETIPYDLPTRQWLNRGSYQILYLPEHELKAKTLKQYIDEINPATIYLGSFFSPRISLQMVWRFPELHSKMIVAARGELAPGSLYMKPTKKKVYLFIAHWFRRYINLSFHASSQLEAEEIYKHVQCKAVLVAPDLVAIPKTIDKAGHVKQKGRLRLCFVSRIVENKNLHFCIDTLAYLVKENPNVTLDVFGTIENEPYWQQCLQQIKNSQLQEHITYKGALTPDAVYDTFRQYDFFYFASMSENFGHVIFESLASGTPVIISNTTFWNGVKNDPPWGFIFDLAVRNEAIRYLKQALDMDNDTYQQMSRNAFNTALQIARSQDALQKNIDLFNLVLPGKS